MKQISFSSKVFLVFIIVVLLLIIFKGNSDEKVIINNNFTNQTLNVQNSSLNNVVPLNIMSDEQKNLYFDCHEDKNCFENKFSKCDPGTFVLVQGSLVTKFEIVGFKDGFCELNIITNDPLDDSKKEICLFDNNKNFFEVIETPENCE